MEYEIDNNYITNNINSDTTYVENIDDTILFDDCDFDDLELKDFSKQFPEKLITENFSPFIRIQIDDKTTRILRSFHIMFSYC